MPLSNDNQDFGKKDAENKKNTATDSNSKQSEMTSEDLKGKQQVDADITSSTDTATDQKGQ